MNREVSGLSNDQRGIAWKLEDPGSVVSKSRGRVQQGKMWFDQYLPSGNLTYGKSPLLMGKSTINIVNGSFSIAILT